MNIIELLLELFEKGIDELKKSQDNPLNDETSDIEEAGHLVCLKEASDSASRVLTFEENLRLSDQTKQYIYQLTLKKTIPSSIIEIALNTSLLSREDFISLDYFKQMLKEVAHAKNSDYKDIFDKHPNKYAIH
jgi:hypothetical protein